MEPRLSLIRRNRRFERRTVAAGDMQALAPNGATVSTPAQVASSRASGARLSPSSAPTVKVVRREFAITSPTLPRASTRPKAIYAISWQRSASSM